MTAEDIDQKRQWFEEKKPIYEALTIKAESLIMEILNLNKISYHSVESRCKEIDSFKNKIEKGIDYDYKEMQDLAGIRIIGYVNSDIELISKLIRDNFDVDLSRSIDKSAVLGIDKVGYKSVHFVVKFKKERCTLPEYKLFNNIFFEIQVRTILQHAWAEIEHDRNYKFSGILPKEINRRFKLLAGVLEVADNEFNQISREIDKYSEEVSRKTKKGDLNIPINSTSLMQYFKDVFKEAEIINFNFGPPENDYSRIAIDELNILSINTLADLDKILTKKIRDDIMTIDEIQNLLGLTRLILIKNFQEKYFDHAWKKRWLFVSDPDTFHRLGINIESLAKKFGLKMK